MDMAEESNRQKNIESGQAGFGVYALACLAGGAVGAGAGAGGGAVLGLLGGPAGVAAGAIIGGKVGAAVGCGGGIYGVYQYNHSSAPEQVGNTIQKLPDPDKLGRAAEKTYEQKKEEYKDYIPDFGKIGRAIEKTAEQLSGKPNYEKEIPSYPAPSEPTHGLSEQDLPRRKQQGR
jgi:hypothetical protein